MIFLVNLRRKKKGERVKDRQIAEEKVRTIMVHSPHISVDAIVRLTGFSKYIVAQIYMKVRRELKKQISQRSCYQ